MLHFQKQESHYILQDFYCGVLKMDSFIKDGLEYILQDPRYNFYIVKDDNGVVVSMFSYSEGKDEYIEIITEAMEQNHKISFLTKRFNEEGKLIRKCFYSILK